VIGTTCQVYVEEDNEQLFAEDRAVVLECLEEHVMSRFETVIADPVIQAFAVFDHRLWPSAEARLESYGNDEMKLLHKHYGQFFLDCKEEELLNEWGEMKTLIMGTQSLRLGKYEELWPKMVVHYSSDFPHFLRLAVFMLLIPSDTSECERIFSLMNDIKRAERGRMSTETLSNLMLIHYLGKNIELKDLKIKEILAEWYAINNESKSRAHGETAHGPNEHRAAV
jgi:hypothetical protein